MLDSKHIESPATPKIRFPGFSQSWHRRSLGDVFMFLPTTPLSRSQLDSDIGSIGNIHYGDIHTKFKTRFDLEKESVPFVGPETTDDDIKKESYCTEGDLVVADASEDYKDIGKTIELINLAGKKVIAGLHTFLLRKKEDVSLASGFPGYLMKSYRVRRQIMKFATGVSVLGISKANISKVQANYPDEEEQKKIAEFLSSVDSWTENLQEQKSSLEAYKKGMMQKLFSQEIRFKDDEGNNFSKWEEKKLGDALKIGSGKDYKHLGAGDIPVFGTGGYMLSVEKALFSGETVFIGRKGTIDKPFYFNGSFWNVDTLFYTYDFKGVTPRFTDILFKRISWKKYSEASGVPSLSKATIEKIKVPLPSLPEQQKIAEFLTSLDKVIESKQQKITQAEQWKKGLMQGLFVQYVYKKSSN